MFSVKQHFTTFMVSVYCPQEKGICDFMRKKATLIIKIIFIASVIVGSIAFIQDKFLQKENRNGHSFYGLYEKHIKRPLDAVIAFLAIIVLSPLLLVISVIVKIKLGSPVLFTQERPGKDSKVFKIYKFRTMSDNRDKNGKLLSDEERLTSFGKKLRETSLDELPEFINVIKGDMSIVGPRPLLMEYLPYYNTHQARRHEVRPGITGLAQVHGRNSISWEEKFDWDVIYVDQITFLRDMKIMFDTIITVLRHTGIHSNASATMESFIKT